MILSTLQKVKYFIRVSLPILCVLLFNFVQAQVNPSQGQLFNGIATIGSHPANIPHSRVQDVTYFDNDHKAIMVANLPKGQVLKECTFYADDSLKGFDFEAASKQAEVEGDLMYLEFRVFMFRTQTNYVKKKYNIKVLPFETAMETNSKQNTPSTILANACSNMDFENGDFTNWVGASGFNGNSGNFITVMGTAYYNTNQSLYDCADLQLISGAYGNDIAGGFPGKDPNGGNWSVRLGGPYINLANCNSCTFPGWDNGTCSTDHWNTYTTGNPVGANGEYISQTFTVTASNALISFDYAVILNDGGHLAGQQPYFHVYVTNSSGTILSPTCTEYFVQAVSGSPPGGGFTLSSLTNPYNAGTKYYWQGWRSNSINLTPYIGQTVTLYFMTAGCTQGGHSAWAYVDATCGPAQILVSNTNPCPGTNVVLTAPAVAGGSYLWSGPGIVGSSIGQSITVNASGNYQVTVIPSQGISCSYTLSQNVTYATAPTTAVSTSGSASICKGSNATLNANATNASNYTWTPGGQTSPSIVVTPSVTTNYSVTVSNANGCTAKSNIVITVNTPPDANLSSTQTGCSSSVGTATALPSGGTPNYTYLWSNGQATQTATGLPIGLYTVTVTDSKGCKFATSINITATTAPSITATSTQAGCSLATGTATANPVGGTPGYTYIWNNGQTTKTATGLSSGTYTIIVSDAIGCSAVTTVNIASTSGPAVTASGTLAGCSVANGTATASPSGGTSPYSYIWTNGQNSQTATGLANGIYTVTVTDANGCTAMTSVTINQTSAITATANSTNIPCNGTNSGSATATPGGGTSPYSYIWTGGQNSQTATGLAAGTYTVTVTDANGCTAVSATTISQSPPITLSVSGNDSICAGDITTLTAIVTGGTPTYTYAWIPGPYSGPVVSVNPTLPTSYSVSIIDASGCSSSAQTFNVFVLPSANASFDTTSSGTFSSTYAFTDASTGGTSWLWNFGDSSATSTQQNPVHNFPGAGTYTVTQIVHNSTGCPDTLRKVIKVKEGILIPNVFTPDGDGVNDVWYIPSSGMKDFHVEIFDRWGAKIFESSADEIRWDGRSSSGKQLTEGTYYYTLKAILKSELGQKDYSTTGYVTLITNKK